MSQTQQAPQLSGKMFLFERPELLNKDQHGHLGMDRPEKPFAFCANVRAIPVTASEMMLAMKHYPIVFLSKEDPMPLAVVGLVDDTNLFVKDDAQWDDNCYIPGYIRRYPFALASETGGERHAIVVDGAHPSIHEGGENRFFTESGESSEATKQAVEFCKQYERDRLVTGDAIKRLIDRDLIQPQNAQYTPQGETEPKTFAQYFGVDEQRLNALDDATFLELRKDGVIPLIYAQLMSMGNWRLLMQRRAARLGLSENEILEKATVN